MPTFTAKLELGQKAFVVRSSGLDFYVDTLTVGQARVTRTLPKARRHEDEKVYEEEYMCVETGVGSGQIWTYGIDIFASEKEAQAGVIRKQQIAYKQRAEREALQKKIAEQKRQADLRILRELKEKYEPAQISNA